MNKLPLGLMRRARHQTLGAIAPAFTIEFVRPSEVRSMPATELNAKPVAFAPSFLRASSAHQQLANQCKQERLRHTHDREFVVGIAGGMHEPVCFDHTDPEQVGGLTRTQG